jgi:uncharacterized membrane protein
MECFDSAILGIGLLGAGIYTTFVPKEEINKLRNILSGKALDAYQKINKERFTQYLQGLGFGFLLALLINHFYGENITNSYHRTTLFLLIVLAVSLFYYLLTPKSDYMLNHLTTPQEINAWLDVYKTMKYRFIVGFLLGAIASVPISNALCKK